MANAGTESRILSKQLSFPTDMMRANRNEPSLAAQSVIAVLSTICRQFHKPVVPLLVRLVRRLVHGEGVVLDARVAAMVRRVGS